jgi:hypothetical protein
VKRPSVVVEQLDEPVDVDAWVRLAVKVALRVEGVAAAGSPHAEPGRSMGSDRSLAVRRSS